MLLLDAPCLPAHVSDWFGRRHYLKPTRVSHVRINMNGKILYEVGYYDRTTRNAQIRFIDNETTV